RRRSPACAPPPTGTLEAPLDLPLLPERETEPIMRLCHLGSVLQRVPIGSDSGGEIPLLLMSHAEQVIGFGRGGIEFQRCFEFDPRRFGLIGLEEPGSLNKQGSRLLRGCRLWFTGEKQNESQ